MKMLGLDYGELPPVLDCELDQDQSPDHIANVILSMAQFIEARIREATCSLQPGAVGGPIYVWCNLAGQL
jgi:hypothetical protein